MTRPFADRREGGRVLAEQLRAYADRDDVAVFALPRGGVPVGYEVARALHAPLDVFVVRKIGVPSQPELAMGAIAAGGTAIINRSLVRRLGVSDEQLDSVIEMEGLELARRESAYRGDRPALDVRGRSVIIVDDGLATGSTMRAALAAARVQQPAQLVAAVPVGAAATCAELADAADAVVCAVAPRDFYAVGQWYRDFEPTTDDEVRALLSRSWGAG